MTVKDETARFVGIISNFRSSGTDTSSPLRGAPPQGEATAETNEPIDPKDFIDIARTGIALPLRGASSFGEAAINEKREE
jgi:hypothetical protein